MSHVTLAGMAKKKTPPGQTPESPRMSTTTIRVSVDIAEKLSIIAAARRTDVSEIASPMLRAQVDRLYVEVVRELGDSLPEVGSN